MATMSPTRFSRQAIVLTLAVGLAWGLSSSARAQHTPDPYNIVGEYNRQYEPYMFSAEANDGGVFSNQNRLNERSAFRNPNRYQAYVDETDSLDGYAPPRLGRSSSFGLPYYQAARGADPSSRRTYRPNEKADKTFYADQQDRDRRYFEALGQSDPVKRAQMLREFRAEDGRNGRALNGLGSRTRTNRDTPRDRLSDDRNLFDSSDDTADAAPRRSASAPSGRRSSLAPAPPSARPRSGLLADPDTPSRRADTSGSLSSPRSSSTSGSRSSSGRTSSSPLDVLKRSRSFDRESRSTQPIDPRTLESPSPR
jgi:hypothetical protein